MCIEIGAQYSKTTNLTTESKALCFDCSLFFFVFSKVAFANPVAIFTENAAQISNPPIPKPEDILLSPITVDASALGNLSVGDEISLFLEQGIEKIGEITVVNQLENGVQVIGRINNSDTDSFSIEVVNGSVSAVLYRNDDDIGYRLLTFDSNTFLAKQDINNFICVSMPKAPGYLISQATATVQPTTTAQATSTVPAYSSKPNANHVIYIDFNGEVVSGTLWLSGATINAAPFSIDGNPSTFNAQELDYIKKVWEGTRDAYSIYNVNVTTSRSVYNPTPQNRRHMIIITPTDTVAPGAGGVAFKPSFGQNYGPAWGFTTGGWTDNRPQWMALVVAHEIGHTLDLNHDGLSGQSYHPGQSSSNANYGWGPYMGAPYAAFYLTWSRGDYSGATQFENDLPKMSARIPFKSDQVGNNNSSPTAVSNTATLTRVIGYTDTDVYRVNLEQGGRLSVNITVNGTYPSLNTQVRLFSSSGQLITQNDPSPTNPDTISTRNASLSYTAPTAGNYYIHVRGNGFNGGGGYSYSNYGAVGEYTMTLTAQGSSNIVPILQLLLLDDED